jgi:hypothetical protein
MARVGVPGQIKKQVEISRRTLRQKRPPLHPEVVADHCNFITDHTPDPDESTMFGRYKGWYPSADPVEVLAATLAYEHKQEQKRKQEQGKRVSVLMMTPEQLAARKLNRE